MNFLNLLVGAKGVVSLPTAVARAFTEQGEGQEIIDPLLTAVGVVRIPFGRSNYGVVFSASTNVKADAIA